MSSADANESESLQAVIELLLKDLREANNTIAKLSEENAKLKVDAVKNYDNSWIRNGKRTETWRIRPTSYHVTTNNRYSILEQEGLPNEGSGNGSSTTQRPQPCMKKKPMNQQRQEKKKILIMSDSHGRGIAENVLANMKRDYSVCGVVKPGSKMCEVLRNSDNMSEELREDDCLIIIGGSNDISRNESCEAVRALSKNLPKFKKGKVFVVGVPHRHDLTVTSIVNEEVVKVNRKFKKIIKSHTNVDLIEIDGLERQYFTQHGQHLNWKGKEVLGNLVTENIVKSYNRGTVARIPLPPSKEINCMASNCTINKEPETNLGIEQTARPPRVKKIPSKYEDHFLV